jgi:hypothetical protein
MGVKFVKTVVLKYEARGVWRIGDERVRRGGHPPPKDCTFSGPMLKLGYLADGSG